MSGAERDPLWFGPAPGTPPRGRFDDPGEAPDRATERPAEDPGGFRVCYLSLSREGAFAESLLRRPAVRLLSRAAVNARALATIEVTRTLRLAALNGRGLVVAGATAAVTHGPHGTARRWARSLWAHPDRVDGIAYRCRLDDDELAIALFDRAGDAVVTRGQHGVRADRGSFGRTLDRYGIALDD